MTRFPRTDVGGVSMPRMIIGTNWFLGFSHTTDAKDRLIKTVMDRKRIADVIAAFIDNGVDAIMGLLQKQLLYDAIQEAQDRTGKKVIVISTPGIPVTASTPAEGFNKSEVMTMLEKERELGATFLFPHQGTTDALVDRATREIRHMPTLCKWIRKAGLIPGLSTHMPESIIYADDMDLDVATYVSIYNAMGFLMQIEVDWVADIIRNAAKPVCTIKPMASGHIRPFQAFNFVWSTIRDVDLVTVGAMTPDEAKECIEISLSALQHREASLTLQETRSKASVKPSKAKPGRDLVRGVAGDD
jgi:hypothetical protein